MLNKKEISSQVLALCEIIQAPKTGMALIKFQRTDSGEPHVEIVSDEYHLVTTERGSELARKKTKDIDELLYWILECITHSMASHYELKNRIPTQDFRRIMFEHQLHLLGKLSPKWRDWRKQELDKTLEKHPFNNSCYVESHKKGTFRYKLKQSPAAFLLIIMAIVCAYYLLNFLRLSDF